MANETKLPCYWPVKCQTSGGISSQLNNYYKILNNYCKNSEGKIIQLYLFYLAQYLVLLPQPAVVNFC